MSDLSTILNSIYKHDFYYDVLNPIWQDFLLKNEDIEGRVSEYRKAKNAFIKQLELVNSLQKKLKSYSDISLEAHRSYRTFKQLQTKNISMIARCEEDVKSFDKEIDCINLKIKKRFPILEILKHYIRKRCTR